MTDSPVAPATAAVAVIVVAAGSGTRLGHERPKAFVYLGGRPMLEHAVDSVLGMKEPVQLIVVAPDAWLGEADSIVTDAVGSSANHATVVAGGQTRQESVARGLDALAPGVRVVLVHDAARALTPSGQCDAVVSAVRATGHGIVPGLGVVDTVKRVDPAGIVLGTVDRSELSSVQTPQGFPREMLVNAVAAVAAAQTGTTEMTDDAAIVAAAGHIVSVIPGHPLAFKITTGEDLHRAELLLSGLTEVTAPRVGTGTDVHAFDDESELWLAGLHWPGERGLSGHSDGDVAVHAICDAILAAAGLGDLGQVFGTDDPRFNNAHGEVFLRETLRLVDAAGFRIGNVSVQIVGNRPRFAPRRAEAERLLASILNAPVNVSATTTDALGFTGRGEGIAAMATALLVPVTPGRPHLGWGA